MRFLADFKLPRSGHFFAAQSEKKRRFFAEPHHHWSGADCRELRQACLHKEELGEEGRGNCRRYREVCRGY